MAAKKNHTLTVKELFEKFKSIMKDSPDASVFVNDEPLAMWRKCGKGILFGIKAVDYVLHGEDNHVVLLWDEFEKIKKGYL